MKKILFVGICFVISIFAFIGVSNAASICASGDTVSSEPGGTVAVKFTTSGVSNSNKLGVVEAQVGALPNGISLSGISSNLSGAMQNGNMISWTDGRGTSNNATITLTLKISDSVTAGNYTIPLTFNCLMNVDDEDYSKTVNATVKVVEKPNQNNNTGGNNNTSGGNNTSAGNNTSGGNTTTPPVVKSGDATIKSLTAQAGGKSLTVSQEYNEITKMVEFKSTIEVDVTAVTFTIRTNSSKATIDSNRAKGSKIGFVKNSELSGQKTYTMSSLKEGSNVIDITVRAENGTTKKYRFIVTRKVDENRNEPQTPPNIIEEPNEDPNSGEEPEEPTTNEVGLKSLVITGVELSPDFNVNTYEYTATIEDNDSVEVIAIPTSEEATVEIAGNKNLVEGENLVTILVKQGDETKTYQVILTKTEKKVNEVVSNNVDKTSFTLTWKQGLIIAAGVVIAIIVVIKLVSMSKRPVEEDYDNFDEDERTSKRGKRFK